MGVMRAADKRRALENHFLFGQLTVDELDTLVTYARVGTFRAREIIFLKGSPGAAMMVVLRGRVRIAATGADGREITLNIIEEGEVFGEIALLDGKERTADAVAATDCELMVIERRTFLPFVQSRPDIPMRLLAVMCGRLRRTTQQVEDLSFLGLPHRLAKLLVHLADTQGRRTNEGVRITVRLSQRELGNMVGTSRESINKQLNQWQKEGLIGMEDGAIVLRDADALRATVE